MLSKPNERGRGLDIFSLETTLRQRKGEDLRFTKVIPRVLGVKNKKYRAKSFGSYSPH